MQDPMDLSRRQAWQTRLLLLGLAAAIEGLLILIALLWAHWRGIPLGPRLHLDAQAALWIGGGTALLGVVNLSAYGLLLRLKVGAVERLHELAAPIFRHSGLPDLLLISLLAGAGEELLFRGVLQAEIGVVGASLLFGLVHFVEPRLWFYPLWAALTGMLFGYMYLWTGNLLVPLAVHAAYDFIALVYIRYWSDPPGEPLSHTP